MNTTVIGINQSNPASQDLAQRPRLIPRDLRVDLPQDQLELGRGKPLSNGQAMNIVLERSMAKLQAVVTEAREALGIPQHAVLDTSAEATGNRIADFALSFFEKWGENHPELAGEEARSEYASFIGGAIQQGIGEARGILSALDVLSPEVNGQIDTTWQVVQTRLDDFISGKY